MLKKRAICGQFDNRTQEKQEKKYKINDWTHILFPII